MPNRSLICRVLVCGALNYGMIAALVAGEAAAESGPVKSPWMSEADLQKTFGAKTVDGHYASGKPFTEQYQADGRLRYREGTDGRVVDATGRWTAKGQIFCTVYDSAALGSGCFTLRRVSANCYEFFGAAIRAAPGEQVSPPPPPMSPPSMLPPPLLTGGFVARVHVTDRPSTCEPRGTV
jgi:hypothetical protein